MTDDSKFILRWEIENSTARLATGNVQSGWFDKGGFRWEAAIMKSEETAEFTLRCELDRNRLWNCISDVSIYLSDSTGYYFRTMERFRFDENNVRWHSKDPQFWQIVNLRDYIEKDKVAVEFHINIIWRERGEPKADPHKFDAPNNRSDVVLLIGEKRVHVSKELLAISSPVFETLFFGDFVEKGEGEVEIKDVDYEEFVDLLHLIYPGTVQIIDRTVQHILKLADRFQIEHILCQCKDYLKLSKDIHIVTKIMIADQFSLVDLREQCLQLFTRREITKQLKSSPEFDNFSSGTKEAIRQRSFFL